MSEWIVTYTSMPIEADSAEEAIEREGSEEGTGTPIRSDSDQAHSRRTQPWSLAMPTCQ